MRMTRRGAASAPNEDQRGQAAPDRDRDDARAQRMRYA
jgi:hypothetical protein